MFEAGISTEKDFNSYRFVWFRIEKIRMRKYKLWIVDDR
jgi:hypothetical protein